MGISGFARYINSWLDADQNEKARILSLLKDAAGIGAVSTNIAGTKQTMQLRGAQEQRTQALFPDVQRTGAAGAGQEESRLATMQRMETGAVEREEAERSLQGQLTETIASLVKAKQFQEAGQVIDLRKKLDFAGAQAITDVEEVRQRGAQGRRRHQLRPAG